MGHPRAFRGPGISAIKLCDLIDARFPRIAVECRQFSDQLRYSHAELGRSHLERVRSVLVDLDQDIGTHATRIPDPEPVSDAASGGDVGRFQPAVVASAACKSLKARGGILVSQTFASWNRIAAWLRRLEGLRGAA